MELGVLLHVKKCMDLERVGEVFRHVASLSLQGSRKTETRGTLGAETKTGRAAHN